jgi:hypothetical protein
MTASILSVTSETRKRKKGWIYLAGNMSDGTRVSLFHYHIDELTFSSEELVGLTEEQACTLRHTKYVALMEHVMRT